MSDIQTVYIYRLSRHVKNVSFPFPFNIMLPPLTRIRFTKWINNLYVLPTEKRAR